MQFDWTTFILEVLNFLVLLWILQRLVYRPVLNILDSRRQRLSDEAAEVQQLRIDAETLHQQYLSQLQNWDQQQQTQRQQLDQELNQLREQALDDLKTKLANEEEKLRARHQAQIHAQEIANLTQATETAYVQAAAMLERLASSALSLRIIEVFIEDLSSLADADQAQLRKAASASNLSGIEVTSAHPLDATTMDKLSLSLSAASGVSLPLHLKEDSRLIAGLRVVIGECQLHANLADELAFFRRQNQHD